MAISTSISTKTSGVVARFAGTNLPPGARIDDWPGLGFLKGFMAWLTPNLTQIYQHVEDRNDGVLTISMLLGKRGTFIFCGGIFAAATLLIFATFYYQHQLRSFFIFLVAMAPMVLFFSGWMRKVWKNEAEANFKNSLKMNILASSCTAICFLTLVILRSVE